TVSSAPTRCSAGVKIDADDPLPVILHPPSPNIRPFLFNVYPDLRTVHSFPTRRSSDLCPVQVPLKLSTPASTFRSEPNEIPEPANRGALASTPITTPPVLPSATSKKNTAANSTVSALPSALYRPVSGKLVINPFSSPAL